MDIKAALDEVSRIEREKTQFEVRREQLQVQLAEKKDALAKSLAELGVSPQDLNAEVSRLERDISEKLEAVRRGPSKTQVVKSRSVDEDILSAFRDD